MGANLGGGGGGASGSGESVEVCPMGSFYNPKDASPWLL